MKALLWAIVAVLIALFFAGDRVRGYFKSGREDVAEASDAARENKQSAEVPARKPEAEARSSSASPSPGNAPELYDSPTRRLGW